MVYSLGYRRPSHVTSSRDSLSGVEKQKSIDESIKSCSSCMSNGIPPALSFDRIISGGTCPPVTVRDFMNYLKYIEHAAENLQFYLWYQDYCARFDKLSNSERALSPEWTQAQADADALSTGPARKSQRLTPQIAAVLKDTEFTRSGSPTAGDPFNTPTKPDSFDDEKRDLQSDHGSTGFDEKTNGSSTAHRSTAETAFDDAGMKWQPFTVQPFRDEISRIIAIYISDGSPRELNLSARERQGVLHALQNSTHPSAFQAIVPTVEYSLRKQAHPNFIRWTICNGNRPRVIFARGLGIFTMAAAFIADLLITLSHASRAWNVLPFIGWFIGIATLIAAWKGMCVVLHGLHHRHLRPWELFSDDGDSEKRTSEDSLISEHSNSYEDEPWVPRYKKRNQIRRIFDREVWVQEPALRQIQDTIFLQSLAASFVFSAIITGIFCGVPRGNFY